ncbi:MAG: hypothetical protein RSD49_08095 [Hafnia sp.]
MSNHKILIKKSKVITEICKALFGGEVKAAFVAHDWYDDDPKIRTIEGLNWRIERLEQANKGFTRHKDNTGTRLTYGETDLYVEFKDGRLLLLQGGSWANVTLAPRTNLEEIT